MNGHATRLAAAFATGVACAIWLLPLLLGPAVQKLRLDRDRAAAEARSLRAEVQKLKESAVTRRTPLVREVTPHLAGPDERVTLAATARLKQEMAPLLGRPVDQVPPLLVYSQFHGRLMRIDGVLYRLHVNLLVLGQEVGLFGVLTPVQETRQAS